MNINNVLITTTFFCLWLTSQIPESVQYSIAFFFIFTLANLSMPLTAAFIGEFLVLIGLFQTSKLIAALASTGMVLGAAYSIWLWNRIACGNLKVYFIKTFADVNLREIHMFIPLIFLTFFLGIYPEVILDTLHMSVKNLVGA